MLTINEIPSHTHGVQLGHNTGAGPDNWVQHADPNGGNYGIIQTGAAGVSQSHNIMPPYYALTYIIKY